MSRHFVWGRGLPKPCAGQGAEELPGLGGAVGAAIARQRLRGRDYGAGAPSRPPQGAPKGAGTGDLAAPARPAVTGNIRPRSAARRRSPGVRTGRAGGWRGRARGAQGARSSARAPPGPAPSPQRCSSSPAGLPAVGTGRSSPEPRAGFGACSLNGEAQLPRPAAGITSRKRSRARRCRWCRWGCALPAAGHRSLQGAKTALGHQRAARTLDLRQAPAHLTKVILFTDGEDELKLTALLH